MEPRISMITLGVKNLKRSIEFYENGLSFPRHGTDKNVAFFSLNGAWLGLYGREELAQDANIDSKGDGFNSFTLSHNVTSESEVHKILEQAVSAGATLVKEAQKVFWGGYSGYFKDYDNHLWEVAFNPFTWIGPERLENNHS